MEITAKELMEMNPEELLIIDIRNEYDRNYGLIPGSVWADAQDAAHTSTGANQFLVRANGGIVLQRSIPAETLARKPRGVFNVVNADSGVAQPAACSEPASTGTRTRKPRPIGSAAKKQRTRVITP